MSSSTDWVAWHRDYQDPASALSHRLRVVQDQLRRALPIRPREPIRVISLCAGRGDDLIEVLRDYQYAGLIRARLVELDPRNVEAMSASAQASGLELDIVQGDAADPTLYEGVVPADIVLLCGVLGNVSEPDVQYTIASLPQLCRTGGTVIWTRSRRLRISRREFGVGLPSTVSRSSASWLPATLCSAWERPASTAGPSRSAPAGSSHSSASGPAGSQPIAGRLRW